MKKAQGIYSLPLMHTSHQYLHQASDNPCSRNPSPFLSSHIHSHIASDSPASLYSSPPLPNSLPPTRRFLIFPLTYDRDPGSAHRTSPPLHHPFPLPHAFLTSPSPPQPPSSPPCSHLCSRTPISCSHLTSAPASLRTPPPSSLPPLHCPLHSR